MFSVDDAMTDHALDLCQRLIRIDTSNPPGREIEAAELLAKEFGEAGLEPIVLESAPGRGNVIARIEGTGEQPPLLLPSHLDVVEADPERWTHPPFSGLITDGCLWGRGAIDMKNHAAMTAALLIRMAKEGVKPKRDIIFAGVADEEAGCTMGSIWLCENHEELVQAEYAIGEGGGFNMRVGGKNYFTIQVAEKGVCWVRAKVTGEPGHGSMPRRDSAVVRLSAAIARLGEKGLPQHSTRVVQDFVEAIGEHQPPVVRPILKRVLHPAVAPHVLRLLPDQSIARGLSAMLGNTASPTVLRAGNKTNVIPNYAEAEIDGRMLPGQSEADFLKELQAVMGDDVEFEVLHSLPAMVTEPRQSALYDTIVDVMGRTEPDSPVVPYLCPGFTDAKAFTEIGIKWYGFSPVKMPPGIRFADLFHGNDERIPVDCLKWGTRVLADVVLRTAGVPT